MDATFDEDWFVRLWVCKHNLKLSQRERESGINVELSRTAKTFGSRPVRVVQIRQPGPLEIRNESN